jgi:hypothetical protein
MQTLPETFVIIKPQYAMDSKGFMLRIGKQ